MSSGTISAHVLMRPDAVRTWRGLLGYTKSYMAAVHQPGSIRGRFGTTDTRNIGHGSDSDSTAHTEIRYFFPDFDFQGANSKESIDIRSFLIEDFANNPAIMKILPKIKS